MNRRMFLSVAGLSLVTPMVLGQNLPERNREDVKQLKEGIYNGDYTAVDFVEAPPSPEIFIKQFAQREKLIGKKYHFLGYLLDVWAGEKKYVLVNVMQKTGEHEYKDSNLSLLVTVNSDKIYQYLENLLKEEKGNRAVAIEAQIIALHRGKDYSFMPKASWKTMPEAEYVLLVNKGAFSFRKI